MKLAIMNLPFAFDVFAQNPCKFYVVATNCLTGKADFLEKNDAGLPP
jgi:predicted patatin/cPLA2 family phospholipase